MYGIMFCLEFYASKREYCYEYKKMWKKLIAIVFCNAKQRDVEN